MRKFTLILLSVVTLFFFISCGSKPENEAPKKPEPPKVEEPVVVDTEPATNVVDDGIDEDDEEARARAEDLYDQILEAKERIDDEELAPYDQKNYDAGVDLLDELEELMDDDNSSGADCEAKAKETLAKFNAVIRAAYKKFAKEERDLAYQAKKNADFVKAGVAEKETYQQAAKDFQDGDSLFSMQAPEKAYNKYVSAKETFTELYETVSEKRAEAAAALEAAKAKVAESAQLASKADNTAPITDEDVDGIEDEDEQLLDEDEFDDPADAEADIPEDINDDGNPVVIENELNNDTSDYDDDDWDDGDDDDDWDDDWDDEDDDEDGYDWDDEDDDWDDEDDYDWDDEEEAE